MQVQIPENYSPVLSVRETQEAIKYICDTFQKEIGKELDLFRISAPLFVPRSSGLNDNLNGIERPVSFDIQEMTGEKNRGRAVSCQMETIRPEEVRLSAS